MKMSRAGVTFAVFLGALAALPPIATDMALPALTRIGDALHSTQSLAGMTLSLFMAGFALSPFFYGPLSDRHGRRPLLVVGLVLFALGGVLATVAPNMTVLLIARLLQGLGAGAGMTLAMAMVRDSFEGRTAQSRLAVITVVANMAPMVAPALGVAVLAAMGWRAIYAINAVSGVLLLVMAWLGLEETAAPVPNPAKASSLIQDYREALSHRSVRDHLLINALGFGWMFGYVAGSPVVLIEHLHASTTLYSILFACTGGGIVAGASLSGWLGQRGVAPQRLIQCGVILAVLVTGAAVVMSLTATATLVTLMPCLVLATAAFGILAPCAAQGALEPLPALAGVTGGLLTSIQMFAGALASLLVSLLLPPLGILGMTATMAGFALLTLLLVLGLARATAAEAAPMET
ncbi:MAG: multidrug effflux MFS transporter [Janthinobacterium lividum]|uniref:multidrug effflux MFS transporter n=1 Tax=Pseudomonas baltica TaxID=2762576 RepID=UPI0028A2BD0D|nr:multidrug effflux MFS transporter [Pseudomonas baltica]